MIIIQLKYDMVFHVDKSLDTQDLIRLPWGFRAWFSKIGFNSLSLWNI